MLHMHMWKLVANMYTCPLFWLVWLCMAWGRGWESTFIHACCTWFVAVADSDLSLANPICPIQMYMTNSIRSCVPWKKQLSVIAFTRRISVHTHSLCFYKWPIPHWCLEQWCVTSHPSIHTHVSTYTVFQTYIRTYVLKHYANVFGEHSWLTKSLGQQQRQPSM